jgi:long-chain fatty acid transport protein
MRVLSLWLFISMIFVHTPIFAGGVENKHNWSAEYMRTLNRNAATDAADAVAYNPAGVGKMGNGFFANLSVQQVLKDYANTVDDAEYASNTPSLLPGIFAVYNTDKWSAFGGVTIPIGGGKVEFDNGNATTLAIAGALVAATPAAAQYRLEDHAISAESYAVGYILGGAFKVHEMISVSIAARYIDSKNDAEGSVTAGSAFGPAVAPDIVADLKFEQAAAGWGGIIGLNVYPTEKLTLAGRYETRTDLDYEIDIKEDNLNVLAGMGYSDGATSSRDLPALLALGVAYQMTSRLRAETNLTCFFQESADWEGAEDDVDNGVEAGLAVEFAFTPEIKASLGYLYTETGIDVDDMLPEAPELDAHSFGGGLSLSLSPKLDMNIALTRIDYISETTSDDVTYEKEATVLAFGLQYQFF